MSWSKIIRPSIFLCLLQFFSVVFVLPSFLTFLFIFKESWPATLFHIYSDSDREEGLSTDSSGRNHQTCVNWAPQLSPGLLPSVLPFIPVFCSFLPSVISVLPSSSFFPTLSLFPSSFLLLFLSSVPHFCPSSCLSLLSPFLLFYSLPSLLPSFLALSICFPHSFPHFCSASWRMWTAHTEPMIAGDEVRAVTFPLGLTPGTESL